MTAIQDRSGHGQAYLEKHPLSSVKRRLQAAKRAMLGVWFRAVRSPPDEAPYRWVVGPIDCTDRDICIFVTYAPLGIVSEQARFHARAWHDQGFAVTLVICADDPDGFVQGAEVAFCDAVLVRANVGYDFGAWATAIKLLPGLPHANRLVTVNDSIYGPTQSFPEMVSALKASSHDLCGAVESMEFRPHIQSFLLHFNANILASSAFRRFWFGVRIGDRKFVIRTCELEISRLIQKAGFNTGVLYSIPGTDNPTLTRWRDLMILGFPYIKAQLLRTNPCNVDLTGWRDMLIRQNYDPVLADLHLRSDECSTPDVKHP